MWRWKSLYPGEEKEEEKEAPRKDPLTDERKRLTATNIPEEEIGEKSGGGGGGQSMEQENWAFFYCPDIWESIFCWKKDGKSGRGFFSNPRAP